MKNCAIICEYNPFHTGHLYQMLKAAKQFDNIICIMSGNFVQRAEPAVANKSLRAEIALKCGASMVLELPVVYATANGERFATGAVKTLAALSSVDALVMGCETDDTSLLLQLAEIQAEESELFKDVLSKNLDDGLPYAAAITEATAVCAQADNIEREAVTAVLTKPNNLLCIEYVKALRRFCPHVKPVFVKRVGNSYNDISASGRYLSATAIREMLDIGRISDAIPFLPEYDILLNELSSHTVDKKCYSKLCTYALKSKTPEEIAMAFDCREGIEYKLKEAAEANYSLDGILSATKSKRYTMSRLKRIVLQVLLGIDKEIMEHNCYIPPRLLAIKESFKPYLTENGKNMIIRASDFERYNGDFYNEYFKIEKRAADVYSLLTDKSTNLFVPQKLITD